MRSVAGVVLVAVLVVAGGCAGLGGSEEPVEFGTETRGDTTFVYFQPVEGTTLPADTVVTINTTIPGGHNASARLGERVDPGTKVYPGGPITGDAATEFTTGGPPAVSQIPRPLYFEVEVRLAVETVNATANRTFTFGG